MIITSAAPRASAISGVPPIARHAHRAAAPPTAGQLRKGRDQGGEASGARPFCSLARLQITREQAAADLVGGPNGHRRGAARPIRPQSVASARKRAPPIEGGRGERPRATLRLTGRSYRLSSRRVQLGELEIGLLSALPLPSLVVVPGPRPAVAPDSTGQAGIDVDVGLGAGSS